MEIAVRMKAYGRGRPEIKICGITRLKEAVYLNEIQAEYAGFVFWEKSKRNVSFSQAEQICRLLDKKIKRVAVTVSPGVGVARRIAEAGFDILQIHGELSEEVLRKCLIPIWRAYNLQKPEDLKSAERHPKIAGYVIDAGASGSGRTFDWEGSLGILDKMKVTVFAGKKFILAGGLDSQNVGKAVRMFQPDVVDVSSGVEGTQGKEQALVAEYAKAARDAGAGVEVSDRNCMSKGKC